MSISPGETYWDRDRETRDPRQRENLILERLQAQLQYAYRHTGFYRELYDHAGVHPDDIRSLEDFTRRIPIVTKAMLRQSQTEHPPFGDYLGVDFAEVQRIQGTSGTTGDSTLFAISRDDWRHISEAQAMQCWAAGMRPDDIVQIAFPLALYVGGWGLLGAAEHMGAKVLPTAGMDSRKQLALMRQTRASVLCATPTYCLHLIEIARAEGIDLAASSWRLAFLGGEPGGSIASVKRRIERGMGLKAIDFGNVAELHPCSNMECEHRTGMHVYQDVDYTEVVNPDNPHEPRPMGERGAVVYTHLWRRSQPMIRYYPGDETYLSDAPCPCGRSYPRLPEGILGRLDDMLIVRGVKFYPSDIEDAVRQVDGLGVEFRIRLFTESALDQVEVQVEGEQSDPAERLADCLKARLGLRIAVSLHPPGAFPIPAFKARRIIDQRETPE